MNFLCLAPLSSSLKSKRHQIKSDPTPFGYEGTAWSFWHVACWFFYFFLYIFLNNIIWLVCIRFAVVLEIFEAQCLVYGHCGLLHLWIWTIGHFMFLCSLLFFFDFMCFFLSCGVNWSEFSIIYHHETWLPFEFMLCSFTLCCWVVVAYMSHFFSALWVLPIECVLFLHAVVTLPPINRCLIREFSHRHHARCTSRWEQN